MLPQSILSSPGYKPSFSAWWCHEVKILGVPPLPVHTPTLEVALLVLQIVEDDVKHVGQRLQKHQTYVAGLRRKHDPYHVFRAVLRDPP